MSWYYTVYYRIPQLFDYDSGQLTGESFSIHSTPLTFCGFENFSFCGTVALENIKTKSVIDIFSTSIFMVDLNRLPTTDSNECCHLKVIR